MTKNQKQQIVKIWEETHGKTLAIEKLQKYWEKEFNHSISPSALRRYLKSFGVQFRAKAPKLNLK